MKAYCGAVRRRRISGARRFSQLIQNAISHPDNVLHYKTCVNISRLNTESGSCDAYEIIYGRKMQIILKNWVFLPHSLSLSSPKNTHSVVFPYQAKNQQCIYLFFEAPFHAKFSFKQ